MAGSIHEGNWLGAGLSHVLEHMLFKGTTTRPGSRIDQEVQEAGGYMNAYTSFDRTVYHIDVPNTGAVTAIDILCDIMQHASLPPDELAKELDVIRREMDMGQDDPGRRSGRRLFETAYTRSPYRFTIIGYLDIFNELKPEDIRAYYHEKYAPNNVFYVVAGDVKRDEVVEQIKKAYAKSKSRALPPNFLPAEPKQTAPREIIEEAPVEMGHLHFAWHIPELRHPDVPVLDVLSVLLGSGRSSRLYQQVRETAGLRASCRCVDLQPRQPGLFGMSAMVDGGQICRRARRDAGGDRKGEIDVRFRRRIAEGGETVHLRHAFLAQDDGRPGAKSRRQLAGGERPEFFRALSRRGQGVTTADVQRVARISHGENRTLYALLPDRHRAENRRRCGNATPISRSRNSNCRTD